MHDSIEFGCFKLGSTEEDHLYNPESPSVSDRHPDVDRRKLESSRVK
jgi:hypothetical protein